jgi:hypothetical protein
MAQCFNIKGTDCVAPYLTYFLELFAIRRYFLIGHRYHRGDEPIPGYHFMRSEGGTESGTFLFASMELATQCEGFVGHLGSGGTMMFHQYMCLHHAGLRGVCPPTYDMRTGLWLK